MLVAIRITTNRLNHCLCRPAEYRSRVSRGKREGTEDDVLPIFRCSNDSITTPFPCAARAMESIPPRSLSLKQIDKCPFAPLMHRSTYQQLTVPVTVTDSFTTPHVRTRWTGNLQRPSQTSRPGFSSVEGRLTTGCVVITTMKRSYDGGQYANARYGGRSEEHSQRARRYTGSQSSRSGGHRPGESTHVHAPASSQSAGRRNSSRRQHNCGHSSTGHRVGADHMLLCGLPVMSTITNVVAAVSI